MVATDDGANMYLLRGAIGRYRSDDFGNVEVVLDPEECNETYEKSSARRSRILRNLRQKVAKRVRSIGTTSKARNAFHRDEENLNFVGTVSTGTAKYSTYDQGSILECRDGPPLEDNQMCETFSTVSSDLSTFSNRKRQTRLTSQWKSCMRMSVRKLLRKEMEDDMKGNPSKYQEFGLHIFPDDAIFSISRDRNRSAFDLRVPTLNTPIGSHEDLSCEGQYTNEDDFPLRSHDELVLEEAMHQIEVQASKIQIAKLFQTKPRLFVSFDDEMAQIIFHTPSSETDEFQAVEVQSVESDIEVISQGSGGPTVHLAYDDGEHFSGHGVPSDAQSCSFTSDGTPKHLGVDHGHPYWQVNHQRSGEHCGAWNTINAVHLEGEVNNPATSTHGKLSRESRWSSRPADFEGNSNPRISAPDFCTLPEIPLPKHLSDKYPYDEDADRDEESHCGREGNVDRHHKVVEGPGMHSAFVKEREPALRDTGHRFVRERPHCECIKCTARSIYQDLVNCPGS
jgi:hypothetical protein